MRVWQPTKEEIETTKRWETWNKGVSEFLWSYDDRETCYILEGEASVTDKEGNSIHFRAGDMVDFNKGLICTWKITKAIRKLYNFG